MLLYKYIVWHKSLSIGLYCKYITLYVFYIIIGWTDGNAAYNIRISYRDSWTSSALYFNLARLVAQIWHEHGKHDWHKIIYFIQQITPFLDMTSISSFKGWTSFLSSKSNSLANDIKWANRELKWGSSFRHNTLS